MKFNTSNEHYLINLNLTLEMGKTYCLLVMSYVA